MDIDHGTHNDLKNLKERLGLKKLGEVVRALVDHFLNRGPAMENEESDGEDLDEPAKKRRIDVRDALYSLEILSKRRGMLEYYTGFDRPAVDLLIQRFREVSWRTPVFFILVAVLELEAVHAYPRFPLTFPM